MRWSSIHTASMHTNNQPPGHAHLVYGYAVPGAHAFEVVTTRYPRETRTTKEDFYVFKLVAYIGEKENYRNCLLLSKSEARASDRGSVEDLWEKVQKSMLYMRRKWTQCGGIRQWRLHGVE